MKPIFKKILASLQILFFIGAFAFCFAVVFTQLYTIAKSGRIFQEGYCEALQSKLEGSVCVKDKIVTHNFK